MERVDKSEKKILSVIIKTNSMDSLFLQNIQKLVEKWRADGYKGVHKETENILTHIKRVSFCTDHRLKLLRHTFS